MSRNFNWLRSWEALLGAILIIVVIINISLSPNFLKIENLANIFHLSIEKAIVALIMAYIIINAEIDLSVASMMGFIGCLFAVLWEREGIPIPLAILLGILVGGLAGAFNGIWVAYAGIPSLVVTLAGLILYRGAARILLETRSIGNFPEWFNDMGQQGFIGPFPFAIFLFLVLFIIYGIILHYSGFGRLIYVIGNNKTAAEFAGVEVRRIKMMIFTVSGMMSALAGILYVSRLGTVRANAAEGFELDIITMVLLGGVSIFGGRGTLVGVGLSLLLVLNIRNGMSLLNISQNTQSSVIGGLLILSVLIPNLAQEAQGFFSRRSRDESSVEIGKEDTAQRTTT